MLKLKLVEIAAVDINLLSALNNASYKDEYSFDEIKEKVSPDLLFDVLGVFLAKEIAESGFDSLFVKKAFTALCRTFEYGCCFSGDEKNILKTIHKTEESISFAPLRDDFRIVAEVLHGMKQGEFDLHKYLQMKVVWVMVKGSALNIAYPYFTRQFLANYSLDCYVDNNALGLTKSHANRSKRLAPIDALLTTFSNFAKQRILLGKYDSLDSYLIEKYKNHNKVVTVDFLGNTSAFSKAVIKAAEVLSQKSEAIKYQELINQINQNLPMICSKQDKDDAAAFYSFIHRQSSFDYIREQ